MDLSSVSSETLRKELRRRAAVERKASPRNVVLSKLRRNLPIRAMEKRGWIPETKTADELIAVLIDFCGSYKEARYYIGLAGVEIPEQPGEGN